MGMKKSVEVLVPYFQTFTLNIEQDGVESFVIERQPSIVWFIENLHFRDILHPVKSENIF